MFCTCFVGHYSSSVKPTLLLQYSFIACTPRSVEPAASYPAKKSTIPPKPTVLPYLHRPHADNQYLHNAYVPTVWLCNTNRIRRHSVAHTVITFERPYTALADVTSQVQQYDGASLHGRLSFVHTLRLFQPLEVHPTLFNIIANAIVFVSDLTAFFEDCRSPTNPLELQKHASLLIYRLFDWYKLGEEDHLHQRNPVDRSICLTLMILLVIATNTTYDVMIQTAVEKLKSSLSECLFGWEKAPDILIWTLLIGSLATYHPQHPPLDYFFFRQYCRVVLADQDFEVPLEVENILVRMKNCIWLPKLDEKVRLMLLDKGSPGGEVVDEVTESMRMSIEADKKKHIVGGLTSGRFFGKRSVSH
jgi:hypothetical protein